MLLWVQQITKHIPGSMFLVPTGSLHHMQNRVIWQCKKESRQKKERGGQREKKGELKGNASEEKTGPLCLCDGPLKWD